MFQQKAYHTYHLTRKTPGESLGFVLVAGAKVRQVLLVRFPARSLERIEKRRGIDFCVVLFRTRMVKLLISQ